MREQRDGEGVTKREEGREGGPVLVVLRRLCSPAARAHLLVKARLRGGGGRRKPSGRGRSAHLRTRWPPVLASELQRAASMAPWPGLRRCHGVPKDEREVRESAMASGASRRNGAGSCTLLPLPWR